MIRFAVVGAGWISQCAFLPAIAASGNSRVQAIVSGNAAGARRLAAFHEVPEVVGYDGYDELVGSDRIDAVYVALPNSMHADFAIRALKAGKHVMVEKPLAVSVAECEEMIKAAKESSAYLMTAYRLHNEPGTLAALQMIREGSIGEPMYFTASFSFQVGPENHRLKKEHWGGPLQDIGIYCLNAARHVFGAEPEAVQAIASSPTGDGRFAEVVASYAVTLRFPGGKLAQFYCSFAAALTERYQVIGTAGEITLDPGFRFESAMRLRHQGNDGTITERTFPQVDQFAGQISWFAECIEAGHAPQASGEEGLSDVAVLRAIEASLASGGTETVRTPPMSHRPGAAMAKSLPAKGKALLL